MLSMCELSFATVTLTVSFTISPGDRRTFFGTEIRTRRESWPAGGGGGEGGGGGAGGGVQDCPMGVAKIVQWEQTTVGEPPPVLNDTVTDSPLSTQADGQMTSPADRKSTPLHSSHTVISRG